MLAVYPLAAGATPVNHRSKLARAGKTHGTILVALAAGGSLVALTDSRLTDENETPVGKSQKLFKLDDQTVCMVAGTYGLKFAPDADAFAAEISGVIMQYVNQLKNVKTAPSIKEKLSTISYLVGNAFVFRFSLRLQMGAKLPINNPSEIIVAGYDTDGKLKIAKKALNIQAISGDQYGVIQGEESLQTASDKFYWVLGGESYPAIRLLDSYSLPSELLSYLSKPALIDYRASVQNFEMPLDLDQMLSLARLIKDTSSDFHRGVGDDEQYALFYQGKIQHFSVPGDLANAPRAAPVTLSAVRGLNLDLNKSWLEGTPDEHFQVMFIGNIIRNGYVDLDRDYFYNDQFENVVLQYNGGVGVLDPTCKFVNTTVVLGPRVNLHSRIVESFLQRPGISISTHKYPFITPGWSPVHR